MTTGGHAERRIHSRVAVDWPMECALTGDPSPDVHHAVLSNICCGGVYFETDADRFAEGTLLNVTLLVPPGRGHCCHSGKVHGKAEVARVHALDGDGGADDARVTDEVAGGGNRRFGVAARFLEPLKLAF